MLVQELPKSQGAERGAHAPTPCPPAPPAGSAFMRIWMTGQTQLQVLQEDHPAGGGITFTWRGGGQAESTVTPPGVWMGVLKAP